MSEKLTVIDGRLRYDSSGSQKLVMNSSEPGEPCCCCEKGCVVTTVTLIRPIVWPGVTGCARGFSKYQLLADHPDKKCASSTKWRIINLPTCQIVASGDIDTTSGRLSGLTDSACYPMPYEPPCPNKGPFTLSSLLWAPLLYVAYAADLFSVDFIAALFGSLVFALHCDGDLSCRYVLQLQTGCIKDGKTLWPGADPCVPDARSHSGGVWGGGSQDVTVP